MLTLSAQMDPTSIAAALATIPVSMWVDARYGIGRDWTFLRGYLNVAKKLSAKAQEGRASLVERFIEQAETRPNRTSLVYKSKSWTWKDIDEETNRLANWLIDPNGLGLKDTSGLMTAVLIGNAPEFLFSIIALWKLGCSVAFLNTMLTGKALQHTFDISKSQTLIVEDLLVDNLKGIWENLKSRGVRVAIYQSAFGPEKKSLQDYQDQFPGLDIILISHHGLDSFPSTQPKVCKDIRKNIKLGDLAALINTSGTTGLPKAAIINHSRLHSVPQILINMGLLTSRDRYYQCLPMFHSSGMIGVLGSWISGCTLVLARKFSAKSWWRDCAEHQVTFAQYIGELIRYLVASPQDLPFEKYGVEGGHRVRAVFGNGMRPEIWEKFKERFGVKEVFEFYAASEGNTFLLNVQKGNHGIGSIGFTGGLLTALKARPTVVKIDLDTEEPIRDPKSGLCILCGPDEVGEGLGLIETAEKSFMGVTNYSGYYDNEKASQKKVLQHVKVKGDAYFRTGDLLKYDKDGFWYFVDRIGDTFRWHGENVSTAEVASVMSEFPGLQECNVYGVQIPGMDGRCGMSAIVFAPDAVSEDSMNVVGQGDGGVGGAVGKVLSIDEEEKILRDMGKFVKGKLARYAVPKFVRVMNQMQVTATHKHRKVDLQQVNFDLDKCGSDRIYWMDPDKENEGYIPFTRQDMARVMNGKAKL